MTTLQQQVEDLQRMEFLKRVYAIAGGDPERYVPAGDLGTELGLPYETAIQLTNDLHARGWVERVGDLAPPHGPRVHITAQGAEQVRRAAAAT